jgi:hypothetical protein
LSSWASGGTTGGASIRNESKRDAFEKRRRGGRALGKRERNSGVGKNDKKGDASTELGSEKSTSFIYFNRKTAKRE